MPSLRTMIPFPTATQVDFARFYDDPHYWVGVHGLGVVTWRQRTGDTQIVYYYDGREHDGM